MNARCIEAEYVYSTRTLFATLTLFLPSIMLKQITHVTPTKALFCNLCVQSFTQLQHVSAVIFWCQLPEDGEIRESKHVGAM